MIEILICISIALIIASIICNAIAFYYANKACRYAKKSVDHANQAVNIIKNRLRR